MHNQIFNPQTKELSNGRLAMLAAAGMCVQELVNGKPILADLRDRDWGKVGVGVQLHSEGQVTSGQSPLQMQ